MNSSLKQIPDNLDTIQENNLVFLFTTEEKRKTLFGSIHYPEFSSLCSILLIPQGWLLEKQSFSFYQKLFFIGKWNLDSCRLIVNIYLCLFFNCMILFQISCCFFDSRESVTSSDICDTTWGHKGSVTRFKRNIPSVSMILMHRPK